MNNDSELLRRYAREGANDAFAEIVRRHVNFVYSAALRQVNGDAHLAADVTQLVFVDLARKANEVATHRVLAGWLFTSTRFVAAKVVRGEQRRRVREREAQLMQQIDQDDTPAELDWQRARPVIDAALAELPAADREAILLRFFEGRDYASIGAQLSLGDNTARMRVDRALEKLRALLERRGVTSTSAALAVTLSHQAVAAAPIGLAASVTGAVLGGGCGAAGAVGATGMMAAAMEFMSITKIQIGVSAALAVVAGTGYVVQADVNAELRANIASLQQRGEKVPDLERENTRLKRSVIEVADLRADDAEFERLQGQAAVLRTRLQQLARAEAARAAAARQAGMEVLELSALDQTPRPKFQARPQYPPEMRQEGIGGEVVVDFVVDADGNVQRAHAVRSTHRAFEAFAVQAISKWKFNPGRKGGRDVNTHMQVPMVFSLEGSSIPPATLTKSSDPASPPTENAVQMQQFEVVGK